MNDSLSILILAIIQGIAEWFPISSSGHLVLFSKILNFNATLSLVVALHLGSLLAAIVYFRQDIYSLIKGFFSFNSGNEQFKLAWYIILATIPAAFVGYFLRNFVESSLNNLYYLAIGFAFTGFLMILASSNIGTYSSKKTTLKTSLIMGFAQVMAVFRGFSRTGSTLSAGLFSGLEIKTATRFSFLMSIPIILGATALELKSEVFSPEYLWPMAVSFIVAYITITLLLRIILVSRKNLRWFGLYLLFAALLALYLATR